MSQVALPASRLPKASASDFLREIDMFFEEKGEVHQSLRRLVQRLGREGIPYAIVGGLAVNAHGHERMTKDVDVLLTKAGFARFCELFVPKHYTPTGRSPRRFVDKKNQRGIDVLVTGFFPGTGKPGPIAYPDPAEVQQPIKKINFINLPTLIQLKLAARRYQDFADVVALIRAHNLDESFLPQLHKSLHRDFIECLDEHRRELEYEAQQ
jgi:hypothetical protein